MTKEFAIIWTIFWYGYFLFGDNDIFVLLWGAFCGILACLL